MMGLVVRETSDPRARYRVQAVGQLPAGDFLLLLEVIEREPGDSITASLGTLRSMPAAFLRMETQNEMLAMRPPPIKMPTPGPGGPR